MEKPHPISVILFDLGSTLVHFNAPWPDAFNEMASALIRYLEKSGIHSLDKDRFPDGLYQRLILNEPKPEDGYRQITAAQNLTGLLADFGVTGLAPELIRSALRSMFEVAESYWTPEEDTAPTLQILREAGIRQAIISNAEDPENMRAILSKTGCESLFEVVIDSASFGYAKPGAPIFQEVLRQMNAEPGECIMVGDLLDKDILGANRMGIRSVWITRRSRHANREIIDPEMQPWRKIHALSELPNLLDNYTG